MQVAKIAYQTVPPAQPAQGQAQQSAPPSDGAPAPQAAPPAMGWIMPAMLAVMVFFLFWQGRSQRKKQEAAVSDLKKGDRLATQSGLIGRLVETGTRTAKIEIAPGVKVEILKSSILGRDSDEAAAQASK